MVYVLIGVLLLLVLIVAVTWSTRRSQRLPDSKAPQQEGEELTSLGILEIRPVSKKDPSQRRVDEALPGGSDSFTDAEYEEDGGASIHAMASRGTTMVARPTPVTSESRTKRSNGAHSPEPKIPSSITVKRKNPAAHLPVESGATAWQADTLVPCLHTLRAALGAQTVCLLRRENLASRFHIEGIVSRNAYARSQGRFSSQQPLLTPDMAQRRVTIRRVGEGDLPSQALGYYRAPIVVRQVALAPVPSPSAAAYVLLADTRVHDGLDSPHQAALMTQCADLLGTLLSAEVVERLADEEGTSMEAPPEQEPILPRAMQDPVLLEVDLALRPRHEIIAEEMQEARDRHCPLALALIYLNRAEAIAKRGSDAVTEAEDMLAERLKNSTPGHRVERFGELMFGVFSYEEGEQVEEWALQLQDELDQETGLIEGGASIGIALLQDRHTTGAELRNDATAALQAAYETGACTILE